MGLVNKIETVTEAIVNASYQAFHRFCEWAGGVIRDLPLDAHRESRRGNRNREAISDAGVPAGKPRIHPNPPESGGTESR